MERDAAAYERGLPRAQRKRDGVWFTDAQLALATARRTLRPLQPRRGRSAGAPLRVVDPAVGAGSFLQAAADVLDPPASCPRRLIGIDHDAATVAIARATLAASGAGDVELHHGCGLTDLEPASFDCVLTNPPWETLQGPDHPPARSAALRQRFSSQGNGKLFTYRLFVERAVELLRPGGRLGMIVPGGLWFDREAEPLRRLLLDDCDWQWLYGFENRRRVFDIDNRYRFAAIVATKGRPTRRLRVAFGRVDVSDWQQARPPHIACTPTELRSLSPNSGAFVEIESRRDLSILRCMQRHGRPLLGDTGVLQWRQGDFNMTADRAQFVPREQAEQDGYRHDGEGAWRRRGAPPLLALRQGAMLYDLDGNAGAHDQGTGHRTRWRKPRPDELRPLYLVPANAFQQRVHDTTAPARIALRALSNATNERTAIACLLPVVPCGNSLGVLTARAPAQSPLQQLAACTAAIGSLAFDWALRMRLGGTNLNRFVLSDCTLPRLSATTQEELARIALRLCATTTWSRGLWQLARAEGWCPSEPPATDPRERRVLQTRIDVVIGSAYGLDADDVAWLVRGEPFAKGFHRVERELPPADRRPARWRAAVGGSDGATGRCTSRSSGNRSG